MKITHLVLALTFCTTVSSAFAQRHHRDQREQRIQKGIITSDHYMIYTTQCTPAIGDKSLVGEGSQVEILGEAIPRMYGNSEGTKVRIISNTDDSVIRAESGCVGYVLSPYLKAEERNLSRRNQYEAIVTNSHYLIYTTKCEAAIGDKSYVGEGSLVQVLGAPEARMYGDSQGIKVRVLSNTQDSVISADIGCEGYLLSPYVKAY